MGELLDAADASGGDLTQIVAVARKKGSVPAQVGRRDETLWPASWGGYRVAGLKGVDLGVAVALGAPDDSPRRGSRLCEQD